MWCTQRAVVEQHATVESPTDWMELAMTAIEPRDQTDGAQAFRSPSIMPAAASPAEPAARPARVVAPRSGRSTQQLLASAYAQRLSLLRCDASDHELSQSQRLIERLEASLRAERAGVDSGQDILTVGVRDGVGRETTGMVVDPTLFLG
jgi:hypothetical protein